MNRAQRRALARTDKRAGKRAAKYKRTVLPKNYIIKVNSRDLGWTVGRGRVNFFVENEDLSVTHINNLMCQCYARDIRIGQRMQYANMRLNGMERIFEVAEELSRDEFVEILRASPAPPSECREIHTSYFRLSLFWEFPIANE